MAMSPSPANYSILKGELFFKKNGTDYWQPLGNAPAFTIEPTVETVQHFSSTGGIRELDDETVTQTGANLAITLDEITAQNLGLALMGEVSDYTQTAQTGATLTVATVAVGGAYDLGATGVTNVTVTDGSATPVPYVLGTHYVLNARGGVVRILAKPETAGAGITITFDRPAVTADAGRKVVSMLKQLNALEGAFMCVGKNAKGNAFKITVNRSLLQPSGSIGFISDEYATMELAGRVLRDETDEAFPFGKVEQLGA